MSRAVELGVTEKPKWRCETGGRGLRQEVQRRRSWCGPSQEGCR